ncbi:MAG: PIG-L deacetylase family protein [Candidatus Levyibacteriota bacterium]|jgi:LmbE family N-acetylglucosaminyl deacetylase
MFTDKTILAISPHTDDVELACGGAIAELTAHGSRVYYVGLSDCQDTLINTRFPIDQLAKECRSALRILGVKNKDISIFQHQNKFFCQDPKQIFKTLEKLRDSIQPDLVLIPDVNQTHQDHKVVAEQAISVFRRKTSMLSYEQPWNDLQFTPDFFIQISAKSLSLKMKAIKTYKTQVAFKRGYLSKEFIYGLAAVRGVQINVQYAEGFKVVKFIEKL